MNPMELLICAIIQEIKDCGTLTPQRLAALVRAHNENITDTKQHYAKKHLLPFYLRVKAEDLARWRSWGLDEATEKALIGALTMKPRRTASGVATITVITKPQKCGNECIYCPNDVRMPKSYLSDEPACQRAERNYFDPFLQVASRLRALRQMGHNTEKIELIVLGGTWSDYPQGYQIWFTKELFRALNVSHSEAFEDEILKRLAHYEARGFLREAEDLARLASSTQSRINEGALTYNEAMEELYGAGSVWSEERAFQRASFAELEEEHHINESAEARVVGFVIETRPDAINNHLAFTMRRLGCTKIQMGIQSLDERILALNNREMTQETIARAFKILRSYGFKIHVHFMLNLYAATPELDKQGYHQLTHDQRFLPDEVKLYPCSLVEGTRLVDCYRAGLWHPYTEEELVDTLSQEVLDTPEYVRISRMIRDISSGDIMVGNKKSNLRQMVENNLEPKKELIREIRYREIDRQEVQFETLELKEVLYETTHAREVFLQWVTPENKIAGFLRLSLPKPGGEIPQIGIEESSDVNVARGAGESSEVGASRIAMIREVHTYGKASILGGLDSNAQHSGLGRRLVARACEIAAEQGYDFMLVISSIGTNAYYQKLGFSPCGLYQGKSLR